VAANSRQHCRVAGLIAWEVGRGSIHHQKVDSVAMIAGCGQFRRRIRRRAEIVGSCSLADVVVGVGGDAGQSIVETMLSAGVNVRGVAKNAG